VAPRTAGGRAADPGSIPSLEPDSGPPLPHARGAVGEGAGNYGAVLPGRFGEFFFGVGALLRIWGVKENWVRTAGDLHRGSGIWDLLMWLGRGLAVI
jgi:hypothetical protein